VAAVSDDARVAEAYPTSFSDVAIIARKGGNVKGRKAW
jgi:hypothetical protein